MSMKLSALTLALVRASEKAGCIARLMRSEKALFDLLVEEKVGEAKNKRFVQDFKTLGDVLVQEMVRHDLAQEFPGISDSIYGEESNKFTNTLGESLNVQVQPTEQETSKLLESVLDGNIKASEVLAKTVHQEISMPDYEELKGLTEEVDASDIGIWIDPIDSTAQFIHGYTNGASESGVYEQGLQCVWVVIGVYHKGSGLPIGGVCNQPFCHQDMQTQQWRGRCIWGIHYGSTKCHHIPPTSLTNPTEPNPTPLIVMSSSEQPSMQDKLKEKYHLQYASGAGYKSICVIDKLATCYVLSSGSTFKWDTCGPHAILRSMGGGMLDLSSTLKQVESKNSLAVKDLHSIIEDCSLCYDKPDEGERHPGELWSNAGGLIAYTDPNQLMEIVRLLMA